jgi:photosystem II stability/assembly factor-like uncharacterized protein
VGFDGTVYAAVVTGLDGFPPAFQTVLYRSGDRGEHWMAIFQESSMDVRLFSDPFDLNVLYKVSVYYPADLHFPVETTTLQRSDNAGITWQSIDQTLDGKFISTLEFDLDTPGTVYLATIQTGTPLFPQPPPALYRSVDRGLHWELVTESVGNAIAIVVRRDGLVAAGDQGIFRVYEEGGTVEQISDQAVSCFVADPQVTTTFYGCRSGAIESVDGGVTWTAIDNGLPQYAHPSQLEIERTGAYLHALLGGGDVYDYLVRASRGVDRIDRQNSGPVLLPARDAGTSLTIRDR